MRVLVTGATGFIGGHLVAELLENGYEVAALVRDRGRAQSLADAGVELFEGDITELETLLDPMETVDAVFHVAGWYKVGNPDAAVARAVNVDGTRNVLAAMRASDVERGVYTSTLAVNSDTGGKLVDERYRFDGDHLSVYDRTKARAHRLAEIAVDGGLGVTIVMPGVVYGPGDRGPMFGLWESYLAGELPVIPRGTAYCWGHVEDIARGHRLALEEGRPGGTYMLAGPSHTLVEAFEIAEQVTGIEAPRALPASLFRALSWGMRSVSAFVDPPDEVAPESLRVLAGTTYLGDDSKARAELGFDPRPLETGLKQTLGAMQGKLLAGKR